MSQEQVKLDSVMQAMFSGETSYYDASLPPAVVSDPFVPSGEVVRLHSYGDVLRILKDPELYSKQIVPLEYKETVPIEMGHWGQDNPQNRELKELTVPHFTIKALQERLTGTVDAEVARCTSAILKSGEGIIDYDSTFGRIPRRVMAGYIGLDPDDPVIAGWIPEVNSFATSEERNQQIHDIFDRIIEERKKTFTGEKPIDPVTAVIIAERDGHQVLGESITRDWGRAQLEMLAVASDDTTTMTLGNILQGFADPDSEHNVLKLLGERPYLVGSATEEGLRRYNAVPQTWGRTKQEVVVGKDSVAPQTLAPGTVVNGMITAANFDSNMFADPYALIPGRGSNRHLSLAGETWRACTGRHLVRHIIQRTLASVSSSLSLQWDGVNTPRESGFVRTIKPGSLHFLVEPR